MRLGWVAVAAMGALFAASACVDTSDLTGGANDPCPNGQPRVDGVCADVPTPEAGAPGERPCVSTKLDCGPHAKCDDTSGKAACVCAIGYERTGETCRWLGGLRDQGFANTPAASWSTEGAVTIDPTAPGTVDKGVARYLGPASCDGKALVRQTFPMPAYADAEPFALEVQGTQVGSALSVGFGVFIDGAWQRDFLLALAPKQRHCLGERAYGRDVTIELQRTFAGFGGGPGGGCRDGSTLEIDHAAIVPDATCPPVGKVVNEDFEGNGGWTVSGTGAEVAASVGTKGGRGGRLFTTNNCQSPSLTGSMSTPFASLSRPALTFSFKGTNAQKMRVSVGAAYGSLGEITGNATYQSATLCLPQWAKGSVLPLVFALPNGTGGLCADPNVRDFVVDDAKFATDATCPEVANIIDGGFEAPPFGSSSSWLFSATASFTMRSEIRRTSGAHGGAAYLELAAGQACNEASATQTITVPVPDAKGGPALELWYRAPTVTRAAFDVSVGGLVTVPLPAVGTWTRKLTCLPPNRAGHAAGLEVRAYGGSGTCADTYTPDVLSVDDIAVVTDPSCPSK